MGTGHVVAGAQYSDDVQIKNANGNPVDPDVATLTLAIKNPSGATILSVPETSLTRLGLGHYQYTWSTAADTVTGIWTWQWDATVDGGNLPDATAPVVVLPVGSLSPGDELLTADEVQAFNVATNLDAGSIAIMLAATAASIRAFAGPNGSVTERLVGGASIVMLVRAAASITTVVERRGYHDPDVTLAADDYELEPSAISLRRLHTGTHARYGWAHEVDITYVPVDTTARRKAAQLALIKLELNRNPGLTLEKIGDWEQRFALSADTDLERTNILEALVDDHLVFYG